MDWLVHLLNMIFQGLLENLSPGIREALDRFLNNLEIQAKESPNKIDDMFVHLLKVLFGFSEG